MATPETPLVPEKNIPADKISDINLKAKSFEQVEVSDPIIDQIEKETGVVATKNTIEIFATGPEAFQAIEDSITKATKSIRINIFSWANDSTGERLAKLIVEAHQRTVDIQVRVDRIGSVVVGDKERLTTHFVGRIPQLDKQILSKIKIATMMKMINDPTIIYDLAPEEQSSIEDIANEFFTDDMIKKCNPHIKYMMDNGINVKIEGNSLSHMDHSKVFIFDDTVAYSGGMNIGDDYSGGYNARKGWSNQRENGHWKDYMLKMKGPASDKHRFAYFHEENAEKVPEVPDGEKVHVLQNKGGKLESDKSLAKEKQITFATHHLIDTSSHSIEIEHAYIMDQIIVDKLLAATKRGVQITIIRGRPETAGLERANEKYFRQLSHSNIKIYSTPEVLHSKLITVDSKYTIIGSANLTQESMNYHEESSLLLAHNRSQQNLEASFDNNVSKCIALEMDRSPISSLSKMATRLLPQMSFPWSDRKPED